MVYLHTYLQVYVEAAVSKYNPTDAIDMDKGLYISLEQSP